MSYFEIIDEMQNGINDEMQLTREAYLETEAKIVKAIGDYVVGAEVSCSKYGEGKVVTYTGDTVDTIILDINFSGETKRFSLVHIMTNNFVKFADIFEIGDAWDSAFTLHTTLTGIYKACEQVLRQQQIEAEKKAEADKKAEAKYEELKAKALKDFDKLSNRAKAQIEANEFYYALGWLANHIGTVTASMPDYLSEAFKKYFGINAEHRVIDSKKKTSNGNSMQWTWSFRASVKKADSIPCCIIKHFNDARKAITDTAFIWDLVEDYGFSFGKKQDVEKIAQTIPAKYINSFNEGLTA